MSARRSRYQGEEKYKVTSKSTDMKPHRATLRCIDDIVGLQYELTLEGQLFGTFEVGDTVKLVKNGNTIWVVRAGEE